MITKEQLRRYIDQYYVDYYDDTDDMKFRIMFTEELEDLLDWINEQEDT